MADFFYLVITALASARIHVLSSWAVVVVVGGILGFRIGWPRKVLARQVRKRSSLLLLAIACPFVAMLAVRQDTISGVLGVTWMSSVFAGAATGSVLSSQGKPGDDL
jgi:NhaP-type Na+/H+ or K+/H+ antiporter